MSGTLSITANVTVNGSPVTLSGTGVVAVTTATFLPANWAPVSAPNCPGTGLGVIACGLDPAQAFTLTNTGNVNMTGVTAGALGGTFANNYRIAPLLTTCGNATHTTLAPGATCVVEVQFQPQTSQAAGVKTATISVADSFGTQTSTLNGTDAAAVTFSGPSPSLVTGTTTTHTGTITVTNAATAAPLVLSAAPTVVRVGTAGGAFSIVAGAGTTCTSGATVAAGASCTILVQYAPGTAGNATATATVTVNGNLTAPATDAITAN